MIVDSRRREKERLVRDFDNLHEIVAAQPPGKIASSQVMQWLKNLIARLEQLQEVRAA